MVFPVNTPGYAAQEDLTEYRSFTDYTDQGFVYVMRAAAADNFIEWVNACCAQRN